MFKINYQDSGRDVGLAVKGWKEIIDEGKHHPFNVRSLCRDYKSFIAVDGKRHLGVIQFMVDEWAKEKIVTVGICYVVPNCRGFRIFERLWEAFITHAKSEKFVSIDIGTHASNTYMQSLIETKLAGEREFICYKIKL